MKNRNIIFIGIGIGLLLGTVFLVQVLQMIKKLDFQALDAHPQLLAEPRDNPFVGTQLKNLQTGDTITLGEQSGISFLNFWGTWCKPCLEELPSIEKLYQNRKGEMNFYLVNLDRPSDRGEALSDREGYTFPLYQPVGHLPESAWRGGGIPLSLITRGSEAMVYHFGPANWNSNRVHRVLDSLLIHTVVNIH